MTCCMQHTQGSACKQGQLCMGMAMSTTPAVCPGRGHNIRLGPSEPPGPPRMPSDRRTTGAAGTGRQSEAGNGLKWEGATAVMQRQGRGWASGRGCGGCSGKRGAVQRRGKGKDRDASRKNSRRARQRPRRMNVWAVLAPLRPSTGGRGPAAAVCHRPPCRPRRARSPALSRRPWPGPRPAPPPAAASRAPAPFRPVPPRSPPRAGTAGSCRPPPSRHRHGHRHPCVCPFPGPPGPAPGGTDLPRSARDGERSVPWGTLLGR